MVRQSVQPKGPGVLWRALTSRRTATVALQSLPSGLPLGLVWIAIPAWLKVRGHDIASIGLFGLTQLPWALKFLWAPLLDRFDPPISTGKRGWAIVAQAGLLASTLCLAWLALSDGRALEIDGDRGLRAIALCSLLIALFSATQDIAVDAYAVEVLEPEEQGVAAGGRAALSRFAVFLSGRALISLGARIAWPILFASQALLYIPAAWLMLRSPEPKTAAPPGPLPSVLAPLLSFLRLPRALEITLFLVLYKIGDNLASALISPFLIERGYSLFDVGIANGTIGLAGSVLGAMFGGGLVTVMGLGRALWMFGLLQLVSNIGYVWIAALDAPDRVVMYSAIGVETLTTGMGTGAFAVLLLRLTEKRFSATQYAILSSVFSLGRIAAAPVAGYTAPAIGWTSFFALTMVAALPGLWMLRRFVPPGERDISFYA